MTAATRAISDTLLSARICGRGGGSCGGGELGGWARVNNASLKAWD